MPEVDIILGPGLGQVQQCGRIKSVNGVAYLLSW